MHYKRLLLRDRINQLNTIRNDRTAPKKPNLLQSMRILKQAWELVSDSTIRNCFREANFQIGEVTYFFTSCSILGIRFWAGIIWIYRWVKWVVERIVVAWWWNRTELKHLWFYRSRRQYCNFRRADFAGNRPLRRWVRPRRTVFRRRLEIWKRVVRFLFLFWLNK